MENLNILTKNSIKLSILVPTVPSRIELFYPKLIKNLVNQIKNYKDIELISFFDNKKRTIGKKRSEMLNLAQGEYVVFIDDDDRIADDYISSIMEALYTNPNTDCVVFDTICCVNGGNKKLCKYGIEFEYGDILNGTEWRGKPSHTMVYKSSIAKKHIFKDLQNGEDYDWVKRAHLDISIQTRINKVLYYYDAEYNTTSETANLSNDIIEYNIGLKLKKDINNI
jgi:glycosyltransferase involved in cell wall biosynthesis